MSFLKAEMVDSKSKITQSRPLVFREQRSSCFTRKPDYSLDLGTKWLRPDQRPNPCGFPRVAGTPPRATPLHSKRRWGLLRFGLYGSAL